MHKNKQLSKRMASPIRIGIVGYEGVQGLDVMGPSDAFSLAGSASPEEIAGYEVLLLGLTGKAFRAESGLTMIPRCKLENALPLDTVIIPGGRGIRVNPEVSRRVSEWLKKSAASIRRIASVCTGIYALAPTTLLDGRKVTTHWKFTRDIAQRFPALRVDPNALYIKDGKFYTSAGITAGIDLSLALIEEDYGPQVALAVARELVVYLKRPGGQEQYSEPLQLQVNSTDGFADLLPWIRGHLRQDLSVETLAERAHFSPRHFCRRFKDAFGVGPGEYIENLRLDEARRLLSASTNSIEAVADSVGFASADSFRRAFERRFGVAPSVFRGRFAATAT